MPKHGFTISFLALLFATLPLESRAKLLKRTETSKHSTAKKLFDTKGRKFAYKYVRIPKDIRPLHYDLFLHPNLTSLNFGGKVEILLRCFETTSRIIFHLMHLKTEHVKLVDDTKVDIKVKDISENKERNLMILELEKQLKNGKKYTLSMDFHGKLADNMEGFYKSEYRTKSGEKR